MTHEGSGHACCGGCGSQTDITRREALVSAGMIAAAAAWASAAEAAPAHGPLGPRPLLVQPVLQYDTPVRQKATSWRAWGGIQTDEDARKEARRIERELAALPASVGVPVVVRPLQVVRDPAAAARIAAGDHHVTLIYAAGGGDNLLRALTVPGKWNLMFLRHDPGPVYLWYEIVHPIFLRKQVDAFGQEGWNTRDVVVDSYAELAMRLRALAGLANTLGRKIVAVGGASGWGAGGAKAPGIARNTWKLDLVDLPYPVLAQRIQAARRDSALVARCREDAGRYLADPGVKLKTTREFVDNGFVLTEVLRQALAEAGTDLLTINACMGTIMPMSETTACLPLSLLNDEGYVAFCESDFVVIPSGILLHYIAGKPVFLNDPTYPHGGVVTIAHCTAPRKLDGRKAERAQLHTHFESDYGAAPKVEMRIGQMTTNLVPDFDCKRWVGFRGPVVGNPFLDICRSQTDVRIEGDHQVLLDQMGGFHWMTSYGDYLREVEYALSKLGVGFLNISAAA